MQEIDKDQVLLQALTDATPLLDVRAPVEFARGAFPTATNLPLLTDAERHEVGVRYKRTGKVAAIALAESLVSDDVKFMRIKAWQEYIAANPNAILYCFRGGLRSRTVQEWLAAEGCHVPRVAGGYKRLRRLMLEALERLCHENDFIVVAGKTGSAKTHLINSLPNSVDLEGLAHHRGSSFGRHYHKQPNQVNFENNLAIAMLRLEQQQPNKVFLEDESRAIGSLSVPQQLHARMREAPLAVIETTMEERVQTIMHDYILYTFSEFASVSKDNAPLAFSDHLLEALERIERRLGGEKYRIIREKMVIALDAQFNKQDPQAHAEWIRELLEGYYDPMYDYQLNKKLQRAVFRGTREEFLRWSAHMDVSQSRRINS